MTKFAIALLFAILTLAPMLIAQAEAQEGRDAAQEKLRRLRARLNARAGRFGRALKSRLAARPLSARAPDPVRAAAPRRRRDPPA